MSIQLKFEAAVSKGVHFLGGRRVVCAVTPEAQLLARVALAASDREGAFMREGLDVGQCLDENPHHKGGDDSSHARILPNERPMYV